MGFAAHPAYTRDPLLPVITGVVMDIPEDGIRSNNPFDPDFAGSSEWARMYRSYGLQIVPARMPIPGGEWKMPALASWTEFQENLIPQATFDRWYGANGEHVHRQNMGILTGHCSGNVFVIDLDDQKGPEPQAWWHGLLELHNNGFDPETVQQRTGGGGRQKLFRAPMDWRAPTNKTTIHVDIRGQGGFAMITPSQHESGTEYAWLPGCAPWETEIADAPEWLLEAIDTLVAKHGSRPRTQHTASPEARTNAFGTKIIEGRESYMRDMIWRVVLDWYRQCPIGPPSATESASKMEEAWTVYESCVGSRLPPEAGASNADLLELENRGHSLFANKWRREMKNWGSPRMGGEAKKQPPKPDFTDEFAKAEAVSTPGDVYPFLDVDQIMDKPDPIWVVDGLINERALGFIFGPPSSLKTFIALDLSLSMAAKAATWWDRKINRQGAVVYLCREGTSSFKFRIKAWEMHRKMAARGIPFYLIEHPTNFMKPEDVAKAVATIEAIMAKAGVPVAAVVVDTVSRVLPGAEENLQRDMSLFVGACEIIQSRFQCIVIGVHHTNKNGGIRGSTVIPGAGDFLIETRRETGAMTGSIVLQKVKDGEDGVELPFKVTKLEWTTGFTSRSSLAVDPDGGLKAAPAAGDGLPDMTVCREILAALAQAWLNKMPWCKSANGDRPAVTMIMNRWMLKREAARRLMDGWLANGIVEYDYYDKRNRLRGYRKVTDL
jgi:hypothetical protein